MRRYFTILSLLFFTSVSGQQLFDSSETDRILTTLPIQTNHIPPNKNIIKAIEAIDKKYRQIVDTLYPFKSLKHTILQTVLIETNDSIVINPLTFGENIQTTNIIFDNKYLNTKVDSIAKCLNAIEQGKLFTYLGNCFNNFSAKTKKLGAQPVRIKYIKFPDEKLAQVGIDIYGTHFLWTIERLNNWNVIKVENLWVY